MYWSTWSIGTSSGFIEYAWMDGTHRGILVNSTDRSLEWPRSLSIDFMEKKIYWCDTSLFRIERIGLDGRDREILLERGPSYQFSPFSIAYHNQYIFWYDELAESILRVHVNSTGVAVTPA